MHVAVLGAGVLGVSTAYFLAARGCEVTIIDRATRIAAGATQANGGQLSYSFTDSLAKPSFLPTLPALLAGRDPAVRVRLVTDPPLLGWGLSFLRQCTPARSRRNTIALLEKAARSAGLLASIEAQTAVAFAHRRSGKLVLLPAGANIDAARRMRDLKAKHGSETEVLSVAEACRIEPALSRLSGQYGGAIYSKHDATGDARAFTSGVARWLEQAGRVAFHLGENVQSCIEDSGRIVGVRTTRQDIRSDAVVVCLGAWSGPFLQQAGIATPVYPVRGYSITLPPGMAAPSVSITDLGRRLLFCPLDGRLRIAGFADFVGFDGRCDAVRIDALGRMAQAVAPEIADFAAPAREPWAGSRPMTPDGRPIVGRSPKAGLFFNCGHGMLGWTLAAATADEVAAAVLPG